MHNRQKRARRWATAALLPILVAACGSDDQADSTTAAPTTSPAATTTPSASETTASSGAETTAATEPVPTASCPGVEPGTDPQPLAERTKVVLSSPGLLEAFAPAYVALDDGEFEKENLDVQIITTQTAIQSIATGDVDGAFTAPSIEMINAVDQGVTMSWIAGNYTAGEDTTIGVYARTDVVGSPPDFSKLKGTKLALASNTGITLLTVNQLLQDAGLELADVEITKLAAADGLIALQQGAVASGWLNSPINREVAGDPDYVFMGGQAPDMVGGGLVVGERLLKPENCQITVALLRAMQRVIDGKLAPGYHGDEATVTQLATLFQSTNDAITGGEELLFNQYIPDWEMPGFEDTLIEAGLIESSARVDPSDLVDTSFIKDVIGS